MAKTTAAKITSLLIVAASFIASQVASAEVLDKMKNLAGVIVHYKLVLPNGYDPGKAYPAVLAFPGGPQTMGIVQGTVERNWRAQAEQRGYIVVVPAAPDGDLFFEEGARVFPKFITDLLSDFKVDGGKFHIAGMSNGGLSAFHIAAMYPQYFVSVTGFPGYLIDPTSARVKALAGMCINMHAGELDPDWLDAMKQQSEQFRALGYRVRFTVEQGQPHVLRTLAGDGAARLFNQFDEARHGCQQK
ncbi:MAG: alpha/beta hydrolase-fold protein [Bryobacteraceae bacterium]